MTTTFDQGSDSTLGKHGCLDCKPERSRLIVIGRFTVKWNLAGVPKGQEETLRGALEGYYVNGYVVKLRFFRSCG